MDVVVYPGDVGYSRSSTLLGRLIRVFQRSRGEEESVVNHVIVFLGTPDFNPAPLRSALSVEALATVRLGHFWKFYHGDPAEVAVFRDVTLTGAERRVVAKAAADYSGRLYGGGKLLLHAVDWGLARALNRQDVYFARRLACIDRIPICSWLGAKSYSRVNRHFGVPPEAAQPDDMWDYSLSHPHKWRCALPLQRI